VLRGHAATAAIDEGEATQKERSLEGMVDIESPEKTFSFGIFGEASRKRGAVLYEMSIAKR
jgi:hypothetical protein